MKLSIPWPFPSFRDMSKLLQFWLDQQDKWFYFETTSEEFGQTSQSVSKDKDFVTSRTETIVTSHLFQERLVGRIHDVVNFPPSLMLAEVNVLTVKLLYEELEGKSIALEMERTEREKYGLVFSQVSYYEPISQNDSKRFMENDPRWAVEMA